MEKAALWYLRGFSIFSLIVAGLTWFLLWLSFTLMGQSPTSVESWITWLMGLATAVLLVSAFLMFTRKRNRYLLLLGYVMMILSTVIYGFVSIDFPENIITSIDHYPILVSTLSFLVGAVGVVLLLFSKSVRNVFEVSRGNR